MLNHTYGSNQAVTGEVKLLSAKQQHCGKAAALALTIEAQMRERRKDVDLRLVGKEIAGKDNVQPRLPCPSIHARLGCSGCTHCQTRAPRLGCIESPLVDHNLHSIESPPGTAAFASL